MKINNASKINLILIGVIVILTVTFGLSFAGGVKGKDRREVVKSSLVNPKYKDEIARFELRRDEDFIVLKKEGKIWKCSDDNRNFIVAEQKKVEDFINQLTKVLNLSKISYKNNDLSSFGFNSSDQFTVRYYTSQDNFFDLNFGNHDFSLSNRYVMSGKNMNLYEVDSSFERYLYTAPNQWSDPYIISRNINGEYKISDVQRVIKREQKKDIIRTQTLTREKSDFTDYVSTLLELRHGGAAQVPEQMQNKIAAYEPYEQVGEIPVTNEPEQILDTQTRTVPSLELTLEMGDTSEFSLRFFPNEITGKITVLCQYDFSQNSDRQITYAVEISQWTYEKF